MRFRPLLPLALLFLAACSQSPIAPTPNALPGTTPRLLTQADVPALTAQAGESAVVYIDFLLGTNYVTPALTALGYDITVATDWNDFDSKLAAGTFDLAVGLGQGNGYQGNTSVLASYIAGGGHAVAVDYEQRSALATAFDASYTGTINQNTATFLPPVSVGLTNPMTLQSPGWSVFSTSLAPAQGGVSYCTFEDASSCLVVGNEGRTALLGFVSDTPPEADGQKLFENIFSLIFPAVVVDTTKPTITLTTPADNATYQQDESVTVSYSCADEENGSGIKSCMGTTENGSVLDTTTPGSYSFTVNAEDNAGNTNSVTHAYTVQAKPSTPDSYTIDLETAPANKVLYSVKVGSGVIYRGNGTPNTNPIRVDGYPYIRGKRFSGNQVKAISIGGDKVLAVVKPSTNTPNPTGGELDIKPAQSFGGPSKGKNGLVTLKSITVDGVNSNGAKLILYGNSKPIKTIALSKAPSQTLTLNEPGVGFIQVRANDDFTVDDVVFIVEAKR